MTGALDAQPDGPLIDGGQVNVPEFGFASTDGRWIVEGHGVDPDIVVENDPQSVIAGRDPQLERGVAEVLRLIAAHPRKLPARPAPKLGQHTEELLKELGYGPREISELKNERII